MITLYLKNGLKIEVDDTLESVTKRNGDLIGMKWNITKTGRALQHIDIGEVVAIVCDVDDIQPGPPSER